MLEDLKRLEKKLESTPSLKALAKVKTLTEINYKNKSYPIYAFELGSTCPNAPTLFLTGGVHGLERIGADLALSLLKTTVDRLSWDQSLQELFKRVRLVIVPLVNPVGYYFFKRSNGNDVDLMRNSPICATEKTPFLLGGHRLSKRLPWHQGDINVMEQENSALCDFFIETCSKSISVISIDFHSGFGMKDRLWFPFSYTSQPFDQVAELFAFANLFDQTHPYHVYRIEPQSNGYLLNGDLWDHLYLQLILRNPNVKYLPMTLEMGSWSWVRKNPWQLFSKQGIFNPVKEHRLKRTLRRHHLLFDFLLKAINSHTIWSDQDEATLTINKNAGLKRWYG